MFSSYTRIITRKHGNCECIATRGRARRRAVPIRFNYDARDKFEVTQPIDCVL